MSEAESTKMKLYRGGGPLPKKGPVWFTDNQILAKTHGHVGEYQIDLKNVKEVDLDEWNSCYESIFVRLNPEGAMKLVEDGYHAAVVKVGEVRCFFVPRMEVVQCTKT